MITSLRKGHRSIFTALGIVLPVVFVIGLYERKPLPISAGHFAVEDCLPFISEKMIAFYEKIKE